MTSIHTKQRRRAVRLVLMGALAGSAGLTACQNPPLQTTPRTTPPPDALSLAAEVDGLFPKLVSLRRDLHRHPELAGVEAKTAAKLAAQLQALGYLVQTGHHGHSVVGILQGGLPGKTVAWRADMDALGGVSVADPARVPFKSVNPGVHHLCGHDIHMAIGLGVAELLAKHRALLRGTAMLVFQPEEETFKGAKGMLDGGIFAALKPDEIYALHVTPAATGDIWVKPGEMYAHQRRLRITLTPTPSSNHQADTAAVTQLLQDRLTRLKADGAKPWELQRMADPQVGLGAVNGGFTDYAFFAGPFNGVLEGGELHLEADHYETSAAQVAQLLGSVESTLAASPLSARVKSVRFVQANPTVVNNLQLTQTAVNTLRAQLGPMAVTLLHGQVPFSNDDFAYFQQHAPGVYFFLGASNFAKGQIAMPHAPNFDADEEVLRAGVRAFGGLMLSRLGAMAGPNAPAAAR